MSIFDRERSEIAKLFSEELELGLYSLSSEATYRVISVDGIPAQHTILISCYNDEVYLPFESRSNTNRLTVTDLDYDVRYGQVVNHANIDMRVLNDGMNAENYNSDIYIPSNTKVSLRDLLIRAYQLGGYGSRHDLLNSNEITEEEARMAVAEAVGALTSNEAEPSMQTDKDIRLDTPQAVKEALASGKDLYNPQTGEFWWEYNYTGSIANTYVHLDVQAPSHDDADAHEDGRAVLREAVQVTSHGRVMSCAVHERPVSIHGESTRARAAAAALAAHVDADDEVEEKEDKRRSR